MLFMPGLYGPAQAQAEQNWLSGPVDYSNYMGDMSQGLGQIGPYGPGMGGMGGLLAQQLSMQQSFGGYGGGFPPQMMGYGGYGGFPPQMMGGYGGGFDMYGGQRPMVGFGGTPQPTPPSNPYSSMRAVFNQRQQQRAQVQPMQQAPFGGPQQSPPPVLGIGGPGMAQTPSMGQQAQPAQQAGPNNFLSSMFGKMQQANQRAPGMGQPMAMAAVMPQSYDANPEVLPTNYGSDNTFSAAVMPGFGRPNQPGGGGNQGGGLF
jgi:hypothetical protein